MPQMMKNWQASAFIGDFSDQSHFSTVFKQRFGMTPGRVST
ncbi:AraC family transcriptional regulator [Escherichia coli]